MIWELNEFRWRPDHLFCDFKKKSSFTFTSIKVKGRKGRKETDGEREGRDRDEEFIWPGL